MAVRARSPKLEQTLGRALLQVLNRAEFLRKSAETAVANFVKTKRGQLIGVSVQRCTGANKEEKCCL